MQSSTVESRCLGFREVLLHLNDSVFFLSKAPFEESSRYWFLWFALASSDPILEPSAPRLILLSNPLWNIQSNTSELIRNFLRNTMSNACTQFR